MSDFQISRVQRLRLLAGDNSPLDFEIKPHGCQPGATYVLGWSKPQAIIVAEGEVVRLPRTPVWFVTVSTVVRHRKGFWRVAVDVTDLRDPDVFLRPGGGDSSADLLRAGAKPTPSWLDPHAKVLSEFWAAERLKKHAERMRERSQARRKRAA